VFSIICLAACVAVSGGGFLPDFLGGEQNNPKQDKEHIALFAFDFFFQITQAMYSLTSTPPLSPPVYTSTIIGLDTVAIVGGRRGIILVIIFITDVVGGAAAGTRTGMAIVRHGLSIGLLL